MTVAPVQSARSQDRLHIADGLATAVVVLLPWSLSLSLIFILLWLATAVFAVGPAAIRREMMTAAGGLPVVMFLLALAGMLWSGASWPERLGGTDAFLKLLAIPLLFAQFRHSGRAAWPLVGFLTSCSALLALSWIVAIWPEMAFHGSSGHGVPLKSASTQVREFVIGALALLYLAIVKLRASETRLAAGSFGLAFAFLANAAYVTWHHWFIVPLVALPGTAIALSLLVYKQFGIRAMLGVTSAAITTCVVTYWALPANVEGLFSSDLVGISRPIFWAKSLHFIGEAPILGHGTGSIRELFAESAAGQTGPMAEVTATPHQETLAVGIQLGIVGVALLWAIWIVHLWMFRGNSLADWIGTTVVIFAIIGSLVGSELFDANQGWIYVFGVGISGGVILRTNGS